LEHAKGRRLPLDPPPRPIFFGFFCSIHKNLLCYFDPENMCRDETDKLEFVWRFFLRTFLARKVLKLSKETLKKWLALR
jgi:hypothetical protein